MSYFHMIHILSIGGSLICIVLVMVSCICIRKQRKQSSNELKTDTTQASTDGEDGQGAPNDICVIYDECTTVENRVENTEKIYDYAISEQLPRFQEITTQYTNCVANEPYYFTLERNKTTLTPHRHAHCYQDNIGYAPTGEALAPTYFVLENPEHGEQLSMGDNEQQCIPSAEQGTQGEPTGGEICQNTSQKAQGPIRCKNDNLTARGMGDKNLSPNSTCANDKDDNDDDDVNRHDAIYQNLKREGGNGGETTNSDTTVIRHKAKVDKKPKKPRRDLHSRDIGNEMYQNLRDIRQSLVVSQD